VVQLIRVMFCDPILHPIPHRLRSGEQAGQKIGYILRSWGSSRVLASNLSRRVVLHKSKMRIHTHPAAKKWDSMRPIRFLC
jgi:hypothetical protein